MLSWNDAVELERQIFGGDNRDIARRLIHEFRLATLYELHIKAEKQLEAMLDEEEPTEEELAKLENYIARANKELERGCPKCQNE